MTGSRFKKRKAETKRKKINFILYISCGHGSNIPKNSGLVLDALPNRTLGIGHLHISCKFKMKY